MAEIFPAEMGRESSENDSNFVDLMSPRISFSRGFVGAYERETTVQVDHDINRYSSNFEFSMAASLNTSGNPSSDGAMLSADELISNGKLLPFAPSHVLVSAKELDKPSFSTHPDTDHALPASSYPCLKSSRSYPPARGEANLFLSLKALKCGAKLREFFRFKSKQYCQQEKENMPSGKEEKVSCRMLSLFSRSRSVSVGKLDHEIHHFTARPIFTSTGQLANDKHSCLDIRTFTDRDSSPAIDHEASLHPANHVPSSAPLWMRTRDKKTDGKASTFENKGTCTSSRKISPSTEKKASGEAGLQPPRISSPFVTDCEKVSTTPARIVAENSYNFVSCSSGGKEMSKIHGHTKMTESRVEYWKLAENRGHCSDVRVAPVLLNIPACIAPSSLRGKKTSKTSNSSSNPSHPFCLPKKVKHSLKIF